MRFEPKEKASQEIMKISFFWADEEEKARIHRRLLSMGRQVMNLENMPSSKFLCVGLGNRRVIGWCGLDHQFNAQYPELFSLYLDPEFRDYGLGLRMEMYRALYLREQGIERAYVRMTDDAQNRYLMGKRIVSGVYRVVKAENLETDYRDLCHRCRLFGNECSKQVFLELDVERFLEEVVGDLVRGESVPMVGTHGWSFYQTL